MTTTKTMPEWATVGATVYAREAVGRGEPTLRKGVVTRVTASSIFVRVNTAAGNAGAEFRYTLQRWNDAPKLHGSDDTYYRRTLVSQEDGEAELARLAARREAQCIQSAAARACEAFAFSPRSVVKAEEAVKALQAFLEANR